VHAERPAGDLGRGHPEVSHSAASGPDQCRAVRRDAQVAEDGKVEFAAVGDPVNGRDHWHREPENRMMEQVRGLATRDWARVRDRASARGTRSILGMNQ
jgi:hypothetical protein